MATTFKHIGPVVGLALALSAPASAQASDQQPPSPGAPPSSQQPSPSSQAPGQQQKTTAAEQTARGEIVSIDSTGKILTIKMADGTEQKVTYGNDTKVTGERGGVAGLAKMSGRQVIVHFNNQNANRVATEIEVQPAGASQNTTQPNTTKPADRPGAGGVGDRPGGAGDRPAPGAPGGDKPTPNTDK
jgi:hypothetical protein